MSRIGLWGVGVLLVRGRVILEVSLMQIGFAKFTDVNKKIGQVCSFAHIALELPPLRHRLGWQVIP